MGTMANVKRMSMRKSCQRNKLPRGMKIASPRICRIRRLSPVTVKMNIMVISRDKNQLNSIEADPEE